MEAVIKGVFTFDTPEWKCVSAEAKSLIKRMLEYNPQNRISGGEALADEWIKKYTAIGNIEIPLLNKTLDNMKNFRVKLRILNFRLKENCKKLLTCFSYLICLLKKKRKNF